MSQVNLQEGEISLGERNSITGSSGLHNLTGPRVRFQPVRIKALLSFFDNEDDDTEPRDSDNSDTESLQALPDDDDDDNNVPVSYKDEDPPPIEIASEIIRNDTDVSMARDPLFIDAFGENKLMEIQQSDYQITSNSNSFDSKMNASSSSTLKATTSHRPLKHVLDEIDNLDGDRGTTFTPQPSIDKNKETIFSQNSILSNMKYERRQDNLIDFDNRSKMKNTFIESAMETPMKSGGVITGHQNSSTTYHNKNTLETPQTKSKNEYPQSVLETPGLIFSHWSRNNFFQTPTHNSILLSKKEGQINHQVQDIRLQAHRLCSSENRIVRKPLSEAMHLNQASSVNENSSNNHATEHQSLIKSNLLTKENCPIDNASKSNVANKIVQSLQESNRQNDMKQQNLLAFSMNNEKSNCPSNLESGMIRSLPLVSKGLKNNEVSSAIRPSISDQHVAINDCGRRQPSQHNLNSKNNNISTDSRNEKSNSNGQEMNLPLPNHRESNSTNVQFSVATKSGDKRYGKMINVKGSDYIVLGKLGQGMSGEVLRVQEVKTGELRAIKCVDLSCIEKETAQGCLEEVSMLDRLRAPCIINMITYEIKSHVLYVVMEMGDTDLSKLLKSMSKEKQLPLTMILYYWTEMLTAVKHIHDNGVIHSDLKPANFLLVRGRLKLIDFGIASTVNADMTSVVKNTSLGTLNYISPEAINDVGGNGDSPSNSNQYKINFKSDVWSLGCILYSMVYGQTPFQHIRANWAKVNAITNPNQKIAFPPPESTTRKGYTAPPTFLVDVMQRCLQHDRMARPTVNQLLQIPYVGCNCPPASSLPSISPAILSKIKHSLEENEWRQLLEALERRKPHS